MPRTTGPLPEEGGALLSDEADGGNVTAQVIVSLIN